MQSRLLDPYRLVHDKLVSSWNLFFSQIPNLIGALVFLALVWGLTKLMRRWVNSLTIRRGRDDLGQLLGSVASFLMMTLGFLIAAAIIFPSVSPSSILGTLGIGSVAVGFAFRDILQNLFAGILIVINRPFRHNDVIAVDKYEGTVERVEARATIIRTADGRRIAMPNSMLYTLPVTINTANSHRRDEFELVIPTGQNISEIGEAAMAALAGIAGVVEKPAPEFYVSHVNENGIHAMVRWWTPTREVNRNAIHSAAVHAVTQAMTSHKVALAAPAPLAAVA